MTNSNKPQSFLLVSRSTDMDEPRHFFLQIKGELEKLGHQAVVGAANPAEGQEELLSLVSSHNFDWIMSHNFAATRKLKDLPPQDRPWILENIDTPLNKAADFVSLKEKTAVLFLDKKVCEYVHQFVPPKVPFFWYPEVAVGHFPNPQDQLSFSERPIDILFIGRITKGNIITGSWTPVHHALVDELAELSFDNGQKLLLELALENESIKNRLIDLHGNIYSDECLKFLWSLTHVIRVKRRLHVLSELCEVPETRKINLIVGGQAEHPILQRSNVDFLPFQPWSTVVEYMLKSKIVINTLSNSVYSGHERLSSAMASGAVVLSDANLFLTECFAENEELVFFDFQPGTLSRKVEEALNQPEKMESIRKQALVKVNNHFLMKHAAERLVSICQELSSDSN